MDGAARTAGPWITLAAAVAIAPGVAAAGQGMGTPVPDPPASHDPDSPDPVVGPPDGAILLAGGGDLGPEIIDRFVRLAGGDDARIVVIPTAASERNDVRDWGGLEIFRAEGVEEVRLLHTRDREEADSEAFVAPLRRATGVWFTGGRQWRLVDAYLGTRTHEELLNVLLRGGVVGGSSAGASIQASYLVRGSPEGNEILMAPGYEEGFGFLWDVAVDQHLLTRNRLHDLLEVLRAHPGLLGIGIDEGTAVVIRGDRLEVLGRSRVVIYGGETKVAPHGLPYTFLEAGDRYDLALRALR